jgi:Domain of unknown function (DUF4190)
LPSRQQYAHSRAAAADVNGENNIDTVTTTTTTTITTTMCSYRTSSFATISLVLGISSIPLFYVRTVPGITAIAFGVLAFRQIDDKPQEITGQWMANTGVICGTIGAALHVSLYGFSMLRTRY